MARKITVDEISRHSTSDDVWLVVDGSVYDMTEFVGSHPGGPEIIYTFAGRDASREYAAVHAPSLIGATLPAEKHLGVLDTSSITPEWTAAANPPPPEPSATPSSPSTLPPLSTLINLNDFALAAERSLPRKSWAYISSGSNDNLTRDANTTLLSRILLRPRVMRNVTTVTTHTTLLSTPLALPLFISPMGAALTAGPQGELALAAGAAAAGIVHCISTPASFPHAAILAATPRHCWFQLYLDRDRAASAAALRHLAPTGAGGSKARALLLTADLPVVSKREADERARLPAALGNPNTGVRVPPGGGGFARQTGSFIDPALAWADLPWLRSVTDLPIVVKGIQTAADARLALEAGCEGIVVSNHGGRAADGAPPAILTLLELQRNCPEVFARMEVLVDGGFRRGGDVVKAICLGASAVGIGRPFMYALPYGQEGVEHVVRILKDEIETAMRLCGMTDLMRDAHPDMVNTADIDHLVPGAGHPYARKVTKEKAKL